MGDLALQHLQIGGGRCARRVFHPRHVTTSGIDSIAPVPHKSRANLANLN